jgi:hemin uptake protein HemP
MTKLNMNLAPSTSESQSNTSGVKTPVHSAEDLTAGGNLAQIRLSGAVYTLRITRQDKLILTK